MRREPRKAREQFIDPAHQRQVVVVGDAGLRYTPERARPRSWHCRRIDRE
jgi:hypothetical protein